MLILGVFLIVLVGVGIWLIASAQERAAEARERREAIEAYTDSLRPALGGADETVAEMGLVTTPPRGDALDELAGNTEGWVESLRSVQTQVVEIFPPSEIEPVNQLFNEALSLYISSAQTFALVPDVRGDTRTELFSRAADQRDTASALWASAIGVLDQMRRDHGLTGSGMQAPVPAPGGAAPGAEIPLDPEDLEGLEEQVEMPDGGTGEGPDENDDGSAEDDGGG